MSHTTSSTASLPEAPWKSLFQEHLSTMKSPEFVLATLDKAPEGSPTPFVPRARFCIFRGFWGELPENKHNEAPQNPRVYESELPTFTTDVRMEKVGQLFGTGAGHAEKEEQTMGSGGGGPVEAVWWPVETQSQWRIKGTAFVLAADLEGEGTENSGVRTVKSEVGKRMRCVQTGKEGDWSWNKEIDAHFGNNSPAIRGSFRAPPPGRQTNESYNDKELQLGKKVEDLHDDVARKNFRVVVIRPDSVEQTDLSDPEKSRRYRHTFDDSSGKWNTEELWP